MELEEFTVDEQDFALSCELDETLSSLDSNSFEELLKTVVSLESIVSLERVVSLSPFGPALLASSEQAHNMETNAKNAKIL